MAGCALLVWQTNLAAFISAAPFSGKGEHLCARAQYANRFTKPEECSDLEQRIPGRVRIERAATLNQHGSRVRAHERSERVVLFRPRRPHQFFPDHDLSKLTPVGVSW